jgi:hypothetical protein
MVLIGEKRRDFGATRDRLIVRRAPVDARNVNDYPSGVTSAWTLTQWRMYFPE